MSLEGKVALVTGASRGIGRAVARALAARGARVAVHYAAREAAARETLESLAGEGHAPIGADLADPGQAAALPERAVELLGRLDVVVNNAGIFERHRIAEVDAAGWLAVWRRTLAINLISPAALCHAAVPHLRRAGGGRIINVTSRGAFRGEPQAPAYGSSKAGLNAMSQSLAQALAGERILVFAVAPGFTETDMASALLAGPRGAEIRAQSPFGRVARPEEVARAVTFLADEAPAFMSGAILDVNGASYLRS